MEVKIYALIDPITLKVRYIGRTKCKLSVRLSQHVHKARLGNTHRGNWIKSLLRINCKPYIRLLTTVEGWKESHKFEQALINKYKDRLVNHNDRGEGGYNHQPTIEQKTKTSKSMKEKFKSLGKWWTGKTIYVYSPVGKYLCEFTSVCEAGRELSLNSDGIHLCANNKYKQFCGFQFSYSKKETIPIITKKLRINKYEELKYLWEN